MRSYGQYNQVNFFDIQSVIFYCHTCYLWWFLKPVMFWEKFAWVVTTMIFYVIIFLFIISFILDRIYKEEGEEKTMDENEE
jgi:hypothetical protein